MSNYRIMSPSTCVVSERARIGQGAVVFPNNALLGESEVGAGAMLYPNNILEDSSVGGGCRVTASVLREASVGENTTVGPFAHLRPGARVGNNCRVGNFVEIKNSKIGDGTKIGHLTYVGDADVGKNCNVGWCSAITTARPSTARSWGTTALSAATSTWSRPSRWATVVT